MQTNTVGKLFLFPRFRFQTYM